MLNTVLEAIEDLKSGKIIIVVDDEDRENEGDFLALADLTTADTINFMITHGKGLVCCPITNKLAHKLELPLMVSENTETLKTAFTVPIDHISNQTGISAYERADTIRALVDPESKATDFKRPGHMFPLIAVDGGVLERPGHTEAAIDLAKLCGASPAGVICEITNEDGSMSRLPDLMVFAKKHNMKILSIEELINYLKEKDQ